MKYEMKLHNDPFNKIKNGTKTIELRLNDEKRKLLKEGDIIEFTNRLNDKTLLVIVEKLYKYDSFEELYNNLDKLSLGYGEADVADPKDMEQYYSKEEQSKYGVLGIKIKKI